MYASGSGAIREENHIGAEIFLAAPRSTVSWCVVIAKAEVNVSLRNSLSCVNPH